jgi:DNA-binding response OmpR family regulator
VKVLVIDDEERFLETTRKLLERRGIETLTASNGIQAVDIVAAEPVDVVILDVKMPGLDGIEVLKRIKQTSPAAEVIMLTGHVSLESAIDGLKYGACDYVMKPCDIEDLVARIRAAYERKLAREVESRDPRLKEGGIP